MLHQDAQILRTRFRLLDKGDFLREFFELNLCRGIFGWREGIKDVV